MIVVVGSVVWEPDEGPSTVASATGATAGAPGRAGGMAVEIAREIAASGHAAEIVGKLGIDQIGDDAAVSLGLQRIGHAAVLRDAGRPTPVAVHSTDPLDDEPVVAAPAAPGPVLDRADVELALRYLPEIRVVVVVDGVTRGAVEAASEGASYGGAQLIVLAGRGAVPADLPATATVLEAPEVDEGPFARLVAAYACLLDERKDPAAALAEALASAGWERATN